MKLMKSTPAQAQELADIDENDVIGAMLRKEFTGDFKRVNEEKRVKFEFKLKSRDEHIKNLTD